MSRAAQSSEWNVRSGCAWRPRLAHQKLASTPASLLHAYTSRPDRDATRRTVRVQVAFQPSDTISPLVRCIDFTQKGKGSGMLTSGVSRGRFCIRDLQVADLPFNCYRLYRAGRIWLRDKRSWLRAHVFYGSYGRAMTAGVDVRNGLYAGVILCCERHLGGRRTQPIGLENWSRTIPAVVQQMRGNGRTIKCVRTRRRCPVTRCQVTLPSGLKDWKSLALIDLGWFVRHFSTRACAVV